MVGVVLAAALVMAAVLGIGWFIAPQDELEKSDAIVVVSGGDTNRRVDEGVQLWKDQWAPKLVFSGAAAAGPTSNAAAMRIRAISQGVPASSTVVEERSANTQQNAEYLKPVLEANGIKSVILVSSPYHTRRVKTTFRQTFGNDYRFLTHPAKDTKWSRRSWWSTAETTYLTLDELQKTVYVKFLQH